MSDPKRVVRQTRPIKPFDDKLGIVSLRHLDRMTVLVMVGALVYIAIEFLIRNDTNNAYAILRHVHNHYGRFTLAVATVFFGLSLYIGLIRSADVTPYFRRATYVVVGSLVIESLLGGIMYVFIGVRPGAPEHLIYGAGTVLALPFFIYVETTATKRPAMGSYMWGFALLAGVIIRCLGTGPTGA